MAPDWRACLAIPAAAACLLWPALWNGYPIVFADTGTYLSQAIKHYAGWDRPVFYSLFMLPLHLTVTVWPVVVAQALLTAWILWLVCRVVLSRVSPVRFVAGVALLSLCTWLPWIVSELMPDLFTPLLILSACLLAWTPERLSGREQLGLAAAATGMIASQQSSLPLAVVLLPALAALAWLRRPPPPRAATPGGVRDVASSRGRADGRRRVLLVVLPPALAAFALCMTNLAAHARFAMSPFGNVFLLARVVYDGPGMAVLRRDCPTMQWRLCPFLNDFPPTSDEFLWSVESPLNRAGGPKAVSRDANAIIAAALLAYPAAEARAALRNTMVQLSRFASGDGLNPWPAEVSPWIEGNFAAPDKAAYAAARQQNGELRVPQALSEVHLLGAVGGLCGCILLLPVALARRAPSAGFLLAVLIAVPVSAAITGSLSAPHPRYQSRIMWLPPFVAWISAASLVSSWPSRVRSGNAGAGP